MAVRSVPHDMYYEVLLGQDLNVDRAIMHRPVNRRAH